MENMDDLYLKLENEHIELLKTKIKLVAMLNKFEKACNNYVDGKTDGEINELQDALHEYHEYKEEEE